MGNLFIWMWILGSVKNWVIVLSCVSLLACAVMWILYGINVSEGPGCYWSESQKEDWKKTMVSWRKKIILGSVLSLLLLGIFFLIPSKEIILSYYLLNSVDQYNLSNNNSLVNVNGVIEIIDTTLKKVTELLSRI